MRIGFTQRVEVCAERSEQRECLDVRWIELANCLSWDPVILSSFAPREAQWDEMDGFILTGGNDLAGVEGATSASLERDALETKIIAYAIRTGKPLLGVCRGMQKIGQFFKCPISSCDAHVGQTHELEIILAFPGYSTPQIVNSYHDYGILTDDVDPTVLKLLAKTSDGVAEAFSHNDYRLLGIMWHPERGEVFAERDKTLLSSFFADD